MARVLYDSGFPVYVVPRSTEPILVLCDAYAFVSDRGSDELTLAVVRDARSSHR